MKTKPKVEKISFKGTVSRHLFFIIWGAAGTTKFLSFEVLQGPPTFYHLKCCRDHQFFIIWGAAWTTYFLSFEVLQGLPIFYPLRCCRQCRDHQFFILWGASGTTYFLSFEVLQGLPTFVTSTVQSSVKLLQMYYKFTDRNVLGITLQYI